MLENVFFLNFFVVVYLQKSNNLQREIVKRIVQINLKQVEGRRVVEKHNIQQGKTPGGCCKRKNRITQGERKQKKKEKKNWKKLKEIIVKPNNRTNERASITQKAIRKQRK